MQQNSSFFPHETLRAHKLAVQVSHWVSASKFPRGMAWLKAQGLEAAQSAALNVAEGRTPKCHARIRHYEIAKGSAAEACAALDMVEVPAADGQQALFCRSGAMLARLGA